MKHVRFWTWTFLPGVLVLLALLVMGCAGETPSTPVQTSPLGAGGGSGASPLSSPVPRATPPMVPSGTVTVPIPPDTGVITEPGEVEMGLMTLEEALALAKETVATQTGIAEAAIEVVNAVAVRWPDTSLGCPQKGVMYLQVITPGYRILLRAGGQEYDVRVGHNRAFICEQPTKALSTPDKGKMSAAAQASERARQDLAARLGVPVDEIQVRFIKITRWPDTGLGCPQPGEHYEQVPTEGFLIKLEYGGKSYEYHADEERLILCEGS
ncbi:MAG: hypothetical protein D6759_09685 [Chloroflexi bacterium]|nr:MAG: hypothetical protein D6759_09685 [Chloroflexota bacterium]